MAAASMVCEAGVDTFFSQDFSALEESLAAGTWEVDGTDDDLKLYCAEAKEADPGAVMVTEGGSAAVSELVHRLQEGKGTQVTHLSMELVCEALDLDSNGTFTVGLAFDEDLEEAVLLAVTLRRPRPEPKLPREPGDPPEEPEKPKPIALNLNGQVAQEDVGSLPLRLRFEAELCWRQRSVELCWQQQPGPDGGPLGEVESTSANFYTTNVPFDLAKALFIRATGTTRVRMLSLRCSEGPTES
ncbi:unnamed protein product [Effrenium voratum]|uniref:Uncharacterized protein n=1 Tax=Effrenium voratum TaxID=2562239 RepID=A0AA36MXH4_9DINO|nr:unnamed protein product [Effrenium voratum]